VVKPDKKRAMRLICLWVILWLGMVLSAASAQEAPVDHTPVGPVDSLDEAVLEAQIADLGDIADLNEAKKKILGHLRGALGQLKQAERDSQAADQFKQVIDNAGDAASRLKAQLEKLQSSTGTHPEVEYVLPLSTLEQRLDQSQAEVNLLRNKLASLQTQVLNEQNRPEQIVGEVTSVKQQLLETGRKLGSIVKKDEAGALSNAKRLELLATQEALGSRLNRLQLERQSSSPRLEQVRLEAATYRERQRQLDAHTQQLQKLVAEKRSAEVEQALEATEKARREALNKHTLIQQAAEINAALGERLGKTTERLGQVVRDERRVADGLQSTERKLKRARQQLEVLRFDDAFGAMLRGYQQALPDLHRLQKLLAETRQDASNTRLQQFQVEDQRQQLLDRLGGYDSEAVQRPAGLSDRDWEELNRELDKLDRDRLDLLSRLQAIYGRFEKTLTNLETEQQREIARVEEYQDLLERNLIWIPSAKPMDWSMFSGFWSQFKTLYSAGEWPRVLLEIYISLKREPAKSLLLLLPVLLMLVLRPRAKRALAAMESLVGNVSRDTFSLTLRALVDTLLLALPWVLLLAGLGLLLKSAPTPIGDRLSETLRYVAFYFFLIQVIRYLFIPHGLAEVHFQWDPALNRKFRRQMSWFVVYSMLMAVIMIVIQLEQGAPLRDSVGRAVTLAWLLGFWLLIHFVLNPWSGAGINTRQRRGMSIASWRFLAYSVAMSVFLLLAVLEIWGYRYTVFRLVQLMIESIWLGLLILLLYNLAIRWLLVAERRMALARAREKRQALIEARATKEAAEAAGESVHELPELEEINLSAISGQTRRLLQLAASLLLIGALYPVWSQLTPAVTRLDEIILWQRTLAQGGVEQVVPISLWDVGLNVLVLFLMVVAARNLPGLLEIAILEPMKVGRGGRYAISKLTSYAIYTVGTVLAFRLMGIGWGDVQWLVAAMSVGLGFGLQEIFANLVSGLIILFERPIRIGDTVTIGNVSGTVSRMRMRATTITDWDNKELIIPNKSFVTDPLINWTLSDPITRIVIKVGVAYGSDTTKAHQVMMEVVRAHPDVLEDPPATVFFTGFGDSSLDFEVRVFVPERLKRMPLTHDIHMGLDRALEEAGIEIPFPQRDLHLRSVDPGVDLGGRGGEDPS